MTEAASEVEVARRAVRRSRWRQAYAALEQVGRDGLTAEDLELFADVAWWCCRVDEELELRQHAFTGYRAAGQAGRAAYAAWMLSVRFGLRGEPTTASGWLKRAQRQLAGEPACVQHGYVACSEAEQALGEGRVDEAEEHASRAVACGQRFADPDLLALAVSWQGLCRLARRDIEGATGLLDEAMAAVAAGELDAHFTGWVSCFAIGMCMAMADLRRAGAWAQAAWDWASSLPEVTPYLGLCRVRQVEVLSLRGELAAAEVEAQRACEELLAFEPHLAGEAFYVTGEILRRRGDLEGAERAFAEARELGHDPQPGMALIRLAQGRPDAAVASLRAALVAPGRPLFQLASLWAATVEVALAHGDVAAATEACHELMAIAADVPGDTLAAVAATARGRLRLAEADAKEALAELRPAAATWRALGLAGEEAETRLLIGLALRAMGDEEGARLELGVVRRTFDRLGAGAGVEQVDTLLAVADAPPKGLTQRECEVLRLVASGRTNRQIAAVLVVSEHTVARHLSNIFAKLGVTSRTAATAFAFAHDLA